jgi:hypothetical protein
MGTLGRNYEWHITTRNTEHKLQLMAVGQITINGRKGRITSLLDTDVVVRLFWLPAWVEDKVVLEVLRSQEGEEEEPVDAMVIEREDDLEKALGLAPEQPPAADGPQGAPTLETSGATA